MKEKNGIAPPSPPILHPNTLTTPVDPDDFSDADEETATHLQREIERAEKEGHDQGKPGGLLNRLIQHGNRKTEEQMRREMASRGGDGPK